MARARRPLLLVALLVVVQWFHIARSDSMHPRRPPTEADFIKLGHHETTATEKEMDAKLAVIRERRHWKPWNSNNPEAKRHFNSYLDQFQAWTNSTESDGKPKVQLKRPPNVLIILADDLGYGDLSVQPFVHDPNDKWPCCEGGMLSPNLQRMAYQGTIATNFHSASPVCSPSRVAMMTGLYSWRLGALNAFELGRDLSQRNGFLPQIYATSAEIFRDAGYYTVHSGKWHLGGMREEQRVDRAYHDKCTVPSPNQHGFDEYISELDGPESPRYTFLLRNSILHSKGHRHLLKDDVPMPMVDDPKGKQNVLSDREAGDAIKFIKAQHESFPDQPWFVQVWFNAPHGPWERLDSGQEVYNQHYSKTHEYWNNYKCGTDSLQDRPWHYKTMIAAMDRSIGKLLDAIHDLGIEEDTFIVFTSDNGPEAGAGTAGPYREGKRSLLEGGVRVPAIFQWKGVIPANSVTTSWGSIPDLLPTFMDAAHISRPDDMPIDGISLLPALTKAINLDKLMAYHRAKPASGAVAAAAAASPTKPLPVAPAAKVTASASAASASSPNAAYSFTTEEFQAMLRDLSKLEHHGHRHHSNGNVSAASEQQIVHKGDALHALFGSNGVAVWPGVDQTRSRIFLWHKDTDPFSHDDRYQSGAYHNELKILTSGRKGCLDRVFDLRHDPYESHNLIVGNRCLVHFQQFNRDLYERTLDLASAKKHCEEIVGLGTSSGGKGSGNHAAAEKAAEQCLAKYTTTIVDKMAQMFPRLVAFVKHGNDVHNRYMEDKDNVVCSVPSLNETRRLQYKSSDDCLKELSCSIPEY